MCFNLIAHLTHSEEARHHSRAGPPGNTWIMYVLIVKPSLTGGGSLTPKWHFSSVVCFIKIFLRSNEKHRMIRIFPAVPRRHLNISCVEIRYQTTQKDHKLMFVPHCTLFLLLILLHLLDLFSQSPFFFFFNIPSQLGATLSQTGLRF